MNSIKQLDLFGAEFKFNIRGGEKFKTTFGGIMTFSVIVIILILTYFFGYDLYYRRNPLILTELKTPLEYDPPIQIKNKDFPLIWRIKDVRGQTMSSREINEFLRFKITSIRMNHSKREPPQFDSIIPTDCRNTYLAKDKEFTKNYNLEDWSCVDWESKENYRDKLTIGGGYDNNFHHFIDFKISACYSDFWGPKSGCVDKDFLVNELTKSRLPVLEFLSKEYNLAPEDATDPLKPYYLVTRRPLEPFLTSGDEAYVEKMRLKSDNGWIFESIEEKTVYSLKDINQRHYFVTENKYANDGERAIIYRLRIYMTKRFTEFRRSYMKFQDLAAIIGGIVKFFVFSAQLITHFFNSYEIKKYLLNKIFDDNGKLIIY